MLIQEFHRIQEEHGYLPSKALRELSDRTGTPLYHLQAVSSFFPHYRREKPPLVELRVCQDMACHMAGAGKLQEQIKERLAPLTEKTSDHGCPLLEIMGASCLGRCDRAPAAGVSVPYHKATHKDFFYHGKTADQLCEIVQRWVDNQSQDRSGDEPPPDLDADLSIDWRSWQIECYSEVENRYASIKRFVDVVREEDGDKLRERTKSDSRCPQDRRLAGNGRCGCSDF